MGYYVNENQFMEQDFLNTLKYLESTGVKVDSEISTVYKMNAEVASGNLTNLVNIERRIETYTNQVKNYKEKKDQIKENMADTLKQYRDAKKELHESSIFRIFSKASRQTREKKRQAKKRFYQLKKQFQEIKETLEECSARLMQFNEKKLQIKDILQSCKNGNEALKAKFQEQIDLITDYRARVKKLGTDSNLNRIVTFNGETKPLGSHIPNMQQQLNEYLLTISTDQPITRDSQPFQELAQIESIVYRNEQELTEHQKKGVAKGKEELETERQKYIEKTTEFLNKQSRGETDRDDDGR